MEEKASRMRACIEKAKLWLEYDRAVSEWARVTERFEMTAGRFAERSQELREAAIKARAAYDDHKSSHGC
jgi:hypothetical protein